MKKLALTIAFVLGLGLTTFADPNGGGMFQRGPEPQRLGETTNNEGFAPMLPAHGATGNQPAPLGSGIVLLTALGAAYLVGKKRREE